MGNLTRPELDPEKFFWPPVTLDDLHRDESWSIDTICFTITEEKSNLIFALFKRITMDPALKYWGVKE
jgi:hypothetical protein